MKHPFLILFAAALLVAGCNNHSDNNNSGDVPAGKESGNNSDDTQASLIPDALTDIDGNTYNAVQIGEQVWMAENLKVTKDRDGKGILLGREDKIILSTPCRYCLYNDLKNVEKYGYLYNWEAALRVCPKGWHLPTDAEWKQLANFVSGQSQYVSGEDKNNIAKALASKEGWENCDRSCTVGNNLNGNNATVFGALPAGFYYGSYLAFGCGAFFWSASETDSDDAWYRDFEYDNAVVDRNYGEKDCGYSVRCAKD